MIINIKATNMELTDAIRKYAEEKMEGLVKFFKNITQADIDIGMESHHHQKGKIFYAEVNAHTPQKLVRVRKNAVNLYKAIDKVKDHLKVELSEKSKKMKGRNRGELRGAKEYQI